MTPPRRTANYVIVSRSAAHLTIQDIGPWEVFQTVTNAAEETVFSLVASGDLAPSMRLFYFDSDGELGELLVEDGRFAGFGTGEVD